MNYLDKVDKKVIDYFNVLEPVFPKWLLDYINTKELLKQQYISITCGTIYSDLFDSEFIFSSLDHSIAVALIIWHFTHDKKQALAGLFHDIATPAFKHCIDFMNNDHENQESTEDLTTEIISKSKEIMNLLKRDNINISEVNNYQIYPIADNETPKLSSDRFEYTLSNALFTYKLCDIQLIKRIYEDVHVVKNEENINELAFKNEDYGLEFMNLVGKLSIIYIEDKTRFSMQFIADILKKLSYKSVINVADLYKLKESEIIEIIKKSKYKTCFNKWLSAKKVNVSVDKPSNVYYVKTKTKIRYIDPLIQNQRISLINSGANKIISNVKKYKFDNYVYLDFNLN